MPVTKRLLSRFLSDEGGATAIEYGLLLALVSIFVLGAVSAVGLSLKSTFMNVVNKTQ